VVEVDRGAGAIFVAGRADRLGIAEAPQILGIGLRLVRACGAGQAQHLAQKQLAFRRDQALGKRRGLDQEKPVKAAGRRLLVDRLETVQGRHDVEQRRALDPFRMIAQQPMRHPRAAVVPGDAEPIEAESGHRLDLILRQGAL